jgi:hypothetical protein
MHQEVEAVITRSESRVYANYNTKARTNQESICRNGKADCRKRGEE